MLTLSSQGSQEESCGLEADAGEQKDEEVLLSELCPTSTPAKAALDWWRRSSDGKPFTATHALSSQALPTLPVTFLSIPHVTASGSPVGVTENKGKNLCGTVSPLLTVTA